MTAKQRHQSVSSSSFATIKSRPIITNMMKIVLCTQLITFFHSTNNNVALSFTLPHPPRATTTVFIPKRQTTFRASSLQTTKTVTQKSRCTTTATTSDDLRLFLSQSSENGDSDGDSATPQKKRRRKRKTKSAPAAILPENDDVDDDVDNVVESVDRDDNAFVDIQVRDIRDVIAGGGGRASTAGSSSSPELVSSSGGVAGGGNGDNDLSSLLADAKRLRGGVEKVSDDDDDVSIGSRVSDVISTIVTIDFFVVLGLLAWFLAGVFCSYVIKDDTVQLAFNGIFEPVVQPALGILMLASAAGAALGNKDETN